MEEHFRFTGENPPRTLWCRFPNWQNAYEEETLPDQDETTLRPANNQETIDDDISFTAGDVTFANGQSAPALLEVLCGELSSVHAYPDPQQEKCWILTFHGPWNRWRAKNDDWFLQIGSILRVPVENVDLFPMRVTSRLVLQQSGQIIEAQIGNLSS